MTNSNWGEGSTVLFCYTRRPFFAPVCFINVIHYSFSHGTTILHQSRAMTTSQNRDTMSKPGRKGQLDDT